MDPFGHHPRTIITIFWTFPETGTTHLGHDCFLEGHYTAWMSEILSESWQQVLLEAEHIFNEAPPCTATLRNVSVLEPSSRQVASHPSPPTGRRLVRICPCLQGLIQRWCTTLVIPYTFKPDNSGSASSSVHESSMLGLWPFAGMSVAGSRWAAAHSPACAQTTHLSACSSSDLSTDRTIERHRVQRQSVAKLVTDGRSDGGAPKPCTSRSMEATRLHGSLASLNGVDQANSVLLYGWHRRPWPIIDARAAGFSHRISTPPTNLVR